MFAKLLPEKLREKFRRPSAPFNREATIGKLAAFTELEHEDFQYCSDPLLQSMGYELAHIEKSRHFTRWGLVCSIIPVLINPFSIMALPPAACFGFFIKARQDDAYKRGLLRNELRSMVRITKMLDERLLTMKAGMEIMDIVRQGGPDALKKKMN